ncbi:MAG: ABC transporter permease subunit [Candidatus Nanopelagicales bacterium]
MISALRYEWRRIFTIRTTFILLACALVISLLLGWITIEALHAIGSMSEGQESPETAELAGMQLTEMVFATTGGVIPLIFLGTIAAQAFGQEYRQGTIRLTLTSIPFRGRVFSAKLIVMLLVVAVGWVITTILTYLLMSVVLSSKSGGQSGGLELSYLGRGLLFVLGFCAIVFGVTLLTRILALGVIIPAVFWAVAEPLLITTLGGSVAGSGGTDGSMTVEQSQPWIAQILPFHNGMQFVEGTQNMASGGLVFLAWVVMVLGVSWILFDKRDA